MLSHTSVTYAAQTAIASAALSFGSSNQLRRARGRSARVSRSPFMKINSARPLSGVQCLPKEHEPEEEKPVVTMRAAHESATRPLSRYPHCPPNTSDFVGVDKELNPEQYNAILNGSQRNEIIQTMLESNRAALANLQASANLRATESKLNRSKSSRIRNRISRIFNQ